MSGAILRGVLARAGSGLETVRGTCFSAASAAKLQELPGVQIRSVAECPDANRWAVQGADVVVLGVKPWKITETLREIAADLAPGAIVISVAAGIRLATLAAALGERTDVQLVRAMPNTPALVGQGVTGVAAASAAESGLRVAEALFATVGHVVMVPEEQIDALSAVSGSGPAYLFWFAEQLTAAAERLGFAAEQARLLAENTLIGAAELLAQGEKTAAQLRADVTSPNGTTEKALEVFNTHNPAAMFDAALQAALTRAKEIAASN